MEISKDNLKLLSSRMRAELADRILTLNYSSGTNSPIIARMNIATILTSDVDVDKRTLYSLEIISASRDESETDEWF